MTRFEVDHPEILEAVRRALAEDIGPGDITSEACVPLNVRAAGRFIAREPLVVAGVELLPLIYQQRGGVEEVRLETASGEAVEPGRTLARVRGLARTLLECERVALNFLQRLSGIATLARRFAQAVEGTNCRVLDTRKTTPGLRRLEKMATAAGGISNHRMGLYDAVLIKNNHIVAAGGIREAILRARRLARPIEVEVRTHQEIEQALECGVARLLLDNFTPEQAAAEVRFIAGRAQVEISGGITLENVRAYAETGADFVSTGAVTHSARAVDINFRLEMT
ncbi:MAG: carboxylating nicotinate-nucleotide diphosphorylase [Bryobacterales bacterium]|nr:carboxylating nicotinate-nucleotide diphosphorylase [Bryobacteraceae bacterium]MDW8129038.1 carboxylating nicotinate-nucleotide diphosphorylase [Bryobacterales bacterium]